MASACAGWTLATSPSAGPRFAPAGRRRRRSSMARHQGRKGATRPRRAGIRAVAHLERSFQSTSWIAGGTGRCGTPRSWSRNPRRQVRFPRPADGRCGVSSTAEAGLAAGSPAREPSRWPRAPRTAARQSALGGTGWAEVGGTGVGVGGSVGTGVGDGVGLGCRRRRGRRRLGRAGRRLWTLRDHVVDRRAGGHQDARPGGLADDRAGRHERIERLGPAAHAEALGHDQLQRLGLRPVAKVRDGHRLLAARDSQLDLGVGRDAGPLGGILGQHRVRRHVRPLLGCGAHDGEPEVSRHGLGVGVREVDERRDRHQVR